VCDLRHLHTLSFIETYPIDINRPQRLHHAVPSMHKTCGGSQNTQIRKRGRSKFVIQVVAYSFTLLPQTQIGIDSAGAYYEEDGGENGRRKLQQAQISLNDCLACRQVSVLIFCMHDLIGGAAAALPLPNQF
jgi:hypothetical protein